ncbi:MAG: 3-deoxy-7-phosphoheptulonate synthase [Candidatus Theseobacter exili]|nr:3-deoxy-7-phosphoheptulonate synthase [Candidatus Theseobacter exili]
MIVVLKPSITEEQKKNIIHEIETYQLKAVISKGVERTIIGAIGAEEQVLKARPHMEAFEGVESVVPILKPFKLASRDFKKEQTIIDVKGFGIGGKKLAIIAGPCSVEDREGLLRVAKSIKKSGACFLRGGAFKPRTSPYAFQGLGEEGLHILAQARKETGLLVVSEVMDPRQIDLFEEKVDVLQIGARNMQNYSLLKEVGHSRKPVLLKRGMMSTVKELLMSAEYILSEGNSNVILCERGIRTFEDSTRNTLDINAIPVLKKWSHLPVIVDPSHAAGKRDIIPAISMASIAAGADGLMIEVHPTPQKALSDGAQSLFPEQFDVLMQELEGLAKTVGRTI